MFHKPLKEITKDDIDDLIAREYAENKQLDYKETLPGNSNDSKKEFLADVSAFANTLGGILIYGLGEKLEGGKKTGKPVFVGLVGISEDSEALRLGNMIRDGIEPRITGVEFQLIEGFPDNKSVFLVRVPRSWAAPHMLKNRSAFYARNSNGKHAMDVGEIRSAFAKLEATGERVRNFRKERIALLETPDSPVILKPLPKFILHIIPVTAFQIANSLDLSKCGQNMVHYPPPARGGWDGRYNFDGFLTYSTERGTGQVRHYLQLFRNGIIEAVATFEIDGRRHIPGTWLEEAFSKSLKTYLEIQRRHGVEPPFLVFLTITDVGGCVMTVSPMFAPRQHPVDREVLFLPEIFIESYDVIPETALRPAFDVMWQSCGWPCSPNYDEDGNWRDFTRDQ